MLDINWHPSRRELQQFAGIWLPALGALIGYWVYRGTGSLAGACAIWGAVAAVSVVAYFVPAVARHIFVGWMVAAFPIGWVVSHLLMAAIYYGVLTPIGLVMRLAGGDSLGRRFDKSATTYWVPHAESERTERYFRQF